MAPAARTPKTQPAVSLDLDALEWEGDDPGPFSVRLGGRVYEFTSTVDLDHRDLINAMVAAKNSDLMGALNSLLPAEDVGPFWKNVIPAFKLEKLVSDYMKHFGVTLDAGEVGASSDS